MKSTLVTLVTVCLLAGSAWAAPTYVVDLGNPDVLPAGVTLSQWGETEPSAAHLGGYAGVGQDTLRMVWGNDASGDTTNYAEIWFPQPVKEVSITALDGIANDSYVVYVDGIFWGNYQDQDQGLPETLITSTFQGTAGNTLRIIATSAPWTYHAEYGDLAIDKVTAVVPAPGAILLGMLGTGLVGWLRRRQSL